MKKTQSNINYQHLFHLCFIHSGTPFIVLTNDLYVRLINKAAIKILGLKSEEVCNEKINSIFKPFTDSFLEPNELTKKIATQKITYIPSNGRTLKISWNIISDADVNAGNDSILISGNDITELTNDQLEVLQLENVVKYAPGFFYWKNKDSVYLGCNDEFARLAGLESVAQVKGKTDFDLIWRDRAQSYVEADQKVMQTGEPVLNHEERIFISSNKTITAITNKVPLLDNKNRIIGVLGITTDITQQKMMEMSLLEAKKQAEAANKAKSEFIANMSHDVRTPLAGVIGVSEMLEHEGDTTKDRELGHTIHVSAERLLQLLDDILEVIAADELHETSLNLSTFTLKNRLDFIKDLLTSNTQQYQVDLTFNISEEVPQYIRTDRAKVDRILLNLISNALKFTASGTISISVNMVDKTENEAVLEFKISDTGIGIPSDQLDKIFDRFYRINPSYTNKYKGHGIGLFIVHKYVSLLRGKIMVESELGKGTTFTIVFPIKIGSALDNQLHDEFPDTSPLVSKRNVSQKLREAQPLETVAHPKSPSMHALRVLVIEDDTVARRVVKSMLTMAGFEVEDVADAEQGFWQVMKNSYDFIITDIGLPGMDGYQFTYTVRAWEKSTHHKATPVIGLTAHGRSQQVAAKEAGMDMLFSKPFNEQKLEAINKQFFSKTPVAEELTPIETKPAGLGYDLPDTEQALFELDIYPILDEQEGIKALGGDINFFKEILGILVNETLPEELPLLVNAHERSDWETIQKIAHKLKGGALYCCTTRMRYACQYTERYRLAGHSKFLEPLYQQLLTVLNTTIQYVQTWLLKSGG